MHSSRGKPLISGSLKVFVSVLLFCASLHTSQSQILTLIDQNSTAKIDLGSSGNFEWQIQGWNVFRHQQYFVAIGDGPVQPLYTLTSPLFSVPNSAELQVSYETAAFSIAFDYYLYGGTNVPIGSGYDISIARSDMKETVTLHNSSANPLALHLYWYNDIDIYDETVRVDRNQFDGLYHTVEEFQSYSTNDGIFSMSSIGANHEEVGQFGETLLKLMSGTPVTLNDQGSQGPVTGVPNWAMQWDFNVPSGGNASLINEQIQTQVRNLPEPSATMLFAIGAVCMRFAKTLKTERR